MVTLDTPARIGVLTRGDPEGSDAVSASDRLSHIVEALRDRGATVEFLDFTEETVDHVRQRILGLDGVLVWVDPIVKGRNRSSLDSFLRWVAAQGIFVSTHPDVILKMGTKEVLLQTQDMDWGAETYRYATADELLDRLPARLRAGPRVLKQLRGNGGNGIWRVRLLDDAPTPAEVRVEVLHALRGSHLAELPLGEFTERCAEYFEGAGSVIDQPYQERLGEGMIRCYMVHDGVAGFGHQFVTALLQPPDGSTVSAPPAERIYHGPDKVEFQPLKSMLESTWIAEMQKRLQLDAHSLPVIWDADFLLGPKTPIGQDTYVLCEINVSSVFPIPLEASAPLADAAIAGSLAARSLRER